MGRKSKKQKGKFSLRDVELSIQQGNFQRANKKLINARTKTGEEEKHLSLKLEITKLLALKYFENHEYGKITKFLLPTIANISKQYSAIDCSRFSTIMGVSYLYQQQFLEGKKYLQPQSEKEPTAGFYFLLAVLYAKEETFSSWDIFVEKYNSIFQNINESRKKYTEVVFHLINNNNIAAVDLLENITHESRTNLFNLQVLKNIYAPEKHTFDSANTNLDKVKPLYKLLLSLPISNEKEVAHLESIPLLEKKVTHLQNASNSHSVSEQLEKITTGNKALPYRELEQTLAKTPKEYHPYIIYNQAAIIANEGYQEAVDDKKIILLLDKHIHSLLLLPEGGMLYFEMADFYPSGFSAQKLIASLKEYLSNFGNTLTPVQLANLSWKLFDIFQNGLASNNNAFHYRKQLIRIIENHPTLYGIKWWLFLHMIMSDLDKEDFPKEVLDIFNHDLSKHTQKMMKQNFDGMLETLAPDGVSMSDLLLSMFDRKMDKELKSKASIAFKKTAKKLGETFAEAANEYGVHPNSKILLDCYKITFRDLANNAHVFDKKDTTISSLEKEYENALKLLGEHDSESAYFKDFKSRNSYLLMGEIMDQLGNAPKSKYFLKKVDEFVEELGADLLVDELLDNLEELDYEEELEDGTVRLLMHLFTKTDAPKESPLFLFGQKIRKIVDPRGYGYTSDFFIRIINRIGKSTKGKGVQEARPIYPLLLGYGEKINPRRLHKPVREFQEWMY